MAGPAVTGLQLQPDYMPSSDELIQSLHTATDEADRNAWLRLRHRLQFQQQQGRTKGGGGGRGGVSPARRNASPPRVAAAATTASASVGASTDLVTVQGVSSVGETGIKRRLPGTARHRELFRKFDATKQKGCPAVP